jgi:hypothetical protein
MSASNTLSCAFGTLQTLVSAIVHDCYIFQLGQGRVSFGADIDSMSYLVQRVHGVAFGASDRRTSALKGQSLPFPAMR